MMLDLLLRLDTQVFYFFNKTTANALFDVVMPFVTNGRNWALPTLLLVAGMLYFGKKRERMAVVLIILSVALTDLVCAQILKPAFNRTRPSRALPDAQVRAKTGGRRSFPSNHAANITAAMTILAYFYRRRRHAFYSVAALVSFSRVYVGVHYPLDVVAGAWLGFALSRGWIRAFEAFSAQEGMKIDVIRKIDVWAGVPLCWLFTRFERLRQMFRPAPPAAAPQNILFIELSEMGSAIIACAALQKTRELYPNARLFFLIFDENKESVYLTNLIPREQVLTIRHKSLVAFAADTLAVLRKMRELRIDTAIDMELFSRATALLSYLSGATRRAGFFKYRMEGLYRGNLLTRAVQYNPYQHMAFNFLNLVYALQAPAGEIPKLKRRLTDAPTAPRLESTEAERAAMFAKLRALQPKLTLADTLIVFNPNAGLLPIRAWPLQKYIELARRLTARNGVYIVVMGVKEAASDAAAIAAAIGERCIDLTNKTTLREVIDLFNVAHVLVTNDSGPAHFASLTPIKNFIFFGPETPALYAPLGETSFPIFANYSCSPCLNAYNHRNTPCADAQCVTQIPVDDVYEKILAIL